MFPSILCKYCAFFLHQMQDMNVKLYRIETRLQELVKIVNKLTGFVPVVVSWKTPEFDEFSEPISFCINVDDHSLQDLLSLDTTETSLKVINNMTKRREVVHIGSTWDISFK